MMTTMKKRQTCEISIKGCELLSEQEFLKYRKRIPMLDDYYWLKDCGRTYGTQKCVLADEVIEMEVDYSRVVIRPLILFESDGLAVLDEFEFGGAFYTVIGCGVAISNDVIAHMRFDSVHCNDYTESEAWEWLLDWYSRTCFEYFMTPDEYKKIRGLREV